jgi:hypothetical protein
MERRQPGRGSATTAKAAGRRRRAVAAAGADAGTTTVRRCIAHGGDAGSVAGSGRRSGRLGWWRREGRLDGGRRRHRWHGRFRRLLHHYGLVHHCLVHGGRWRRSTRAVAAVQGGGCDVAGGGADQHVGHAVTWGGLVDDDGCGWRSADGGRWCSRSWRRRCSRRMWWFVLAAGRQHEGGGHQDGQGAGACALHSSSQIDWQHCRTQYPAVFAKTWDLADGTGSSVRLKRRGICIDRAASGIEGEEPCI